MANLPPITDCPSCGVRVIPSSDWICPACKSLVTESERAPAPSVLAASRHQAGSSSDSSPTNATRADTGTPNGDGGGSESRASQDRASYSQPNAQGEDPKAATQVETTNAASSPDDKWILRLAVYAAVIGPLAFMLFVWVPSNGVRVGVIPAMVITSCGCLLSDGIIKTCGWKANPTRESDQSGA
jgi:hypothetical protein